MILYDLLWFVWIYRVYNSIPHALGRWINDTAVEMTPSPLSRSNLGLVSFATSKSCLLKGSPCKKRPIIDLSDVSFNVYNDTLVYFTSRAPLTREERSLIQMICHKSKPCPFFIHAVSMTTQFFLYYRKSNPKYFEYVRNGT